MVKILIVCLFCLYCAACMHLPKADPFRNRTIVKVLAAHLNVGVRLQGSEYEYDASQSFVQVLQQFLKVYVNQKVRLTS